MWPAQVLRHVNQENQLILAISLILTILSRYAIAHLVALAVELVERRIRVQLLFVRETSVLADHGDLRYN